jgi:hypothetical protein
MGMTIFYQADSIPVHSLVLLPTREEAMRFPKGNLKLGFCHACGFVENTIFDPNLQDYTSAYEETQTFSPRFNQFSSDLANRLIERYDLRNKEILDIGCGRADFLVLLCEMGGNHGVGIDPNSTEGRIKSEVASRINLIRDFYSEKYSYLTPQFVCCRHTLEHIQATRTFVQMIRNSIGERLETVVFFEVPDVSSVLREGAFWDIYYEHCSYFSSGSLARLFRSCGFEVLNLTRGFDDQYLLIEAMPDRGSGKRYFEAENDLEELERYMRDFKQSCLEKLVQWKSELIQIKKQGRRSAIWGAGSKGVSYLTSLNITDEIDCVVDINPYKHGMYTPGTGHEIVSPEYLKKYRPDAVFVMNLSYAEEIRHHIERIGLDAKLVRTL